MSRRFCFVLFGPIMEGSILQKYWKNCCCNHWRTENVKCNQNCYNKISQSRGLLCWTGQNGKASNRSSPSFHLFIINCLQGTFSGHTVKSTAEESCLYVLFMCDMLLSLCTLNNQAVVFIVQHSWWPHIIDLMSYRRDAWHQRSSWDLCLLDSQCCHSVSVYGCELHLKCLINGRSVTELTSCFCRSVIL